MSKTAEQAARLARLVLARFPDPTKSRRLIDSVSDHGADYERVASMSDDEVDEMIEMEARFLDG